MAAKKVTIRNLTRPQVAPLTIRWCDDFFSRLRGFTFRFSLGMDEGLALVEKRDSRIDTSIHMFFVWTDLAVAWVDSHNEVVDNVLAKSWRPFYAPARPARYVIEFHPKLHGVLRPGDRVVFEHE